MGELIAFQTSPNLETYTHLLRIRIKDNRFKIRYVSKCKIYIAENK